MTTLSASTSPPTAPRTPEPVAGIAPASTSEEALWHLGAEMRALDRELTVLVEALESLGGRADVDARGALLARRLAAMRARREILDPDPKGR